MSASKQKSVTSDTYALIQQLPISSRRRAVALSALRNAEGIADSILWVVNGIKHLFGGAALKPSVTPLRARRPKTSPCSE